MDLVFLNLLGRGNDHRRIGLESVERRNFAGQRSQRCHLNVAFLGHLLQPRIVVFKLGVLGEELIVVRDLVQHPGIRAGDYGEQERDRRQSRNERVDILHGDGNPAQLSRFVPCHEKYVETFSQHPNFRKAKSASESCRSGTVMLRLGILIPPAASGAGWLFPKPRNQASRNPIWLQPARVAILGSAKYL